MAWDCLPSLILITLELTSELDIKISIQVIKILWTIKTYQIGLQD
jgi:ABC-type dipeptide/oligopeptide/nickel transport system ATPase subunit